MTGHLETEEVVSSSKGQQHSSQVKEMFILQTTVTKGPLWKLV